jgi:polyisoprenoid-binding protein YceI
MLLAESSEHQFRPGPENRLTLTVEKTGIWRGRAHVFEFQRYSAKATIDPANPGASAVELSIEAGSAVCRDKWLSDGDREKVLAFMRKDMLDIAHHPFLTFRSEKVSARGDGAYEIVGRLTVRGIEKPSIVTARVEESGGAVVVSGQATVKLSDYGLTPPKAALGMIGTKNETTVRFRLAASAVSQ